MSLIEEALKKQQEELGANKGPNPLSLAPQPAPAEPPPPAPPADKQEAGPQERKPFLSRARLLLLLGIGAGLIVLLIGVVYLMNIGVIPGGTRPAASAPPPSMVAENLAGKEAPVPKTAAKTPTNGAPTPIAVTVENPPSNRALTTAEASNEIPAEAVAEKTVPEGEEETASAATDAPPAKPASVRVKAPSPKIILKEPVVWPALTLTGIMNAGGSHKSLAQINNQLIAEGETIEGVKVLAIARDGVKVSYEGEQRTLRIGGYSEN